MGVSWLKVEITTPDKPEILAVAARLDLDPDIVFARWFRLWCWADQNLSRNGHARSVTLAQLDRIAGVTGLAAGFAEQGWIVEAEDGVTFANFDRHNGKSSKERALAQDRQRQRRETVTEMSRSGRDKIVTRERVDKRRVKDSSNDESCSEPASGSEPAILVFPCVGRGSKEFRLTQAKIDEYAETYPAVNVLTECRAALQWCRDNPKRRKTAKGVPAFLGKWMARQQNQGGNGRAAGAADSRNRVPADQTTYFE